ncbi:MAG: glycosyltransferase family 39 protein, partial [Thermoanaerobaculia bacterium]
WSAQTFPELIDDLRRDLVHPPLDYVVQHALGGVGAPEWARRIPAVVFGSVTAGFIMLLGYWWHSPVAGTVAGFLLAISPNHIRYSQEVRPYAMGIFFLVAALVALELHARTGRRRWAIWWFALVFLAGGTLYLAALVAAIASLTRIALERRYAFRMLWRRLPLVVIAWTLLYAPWLGVVLSAARTRPPMKAETLDWPWWQHRLHTFGTGGEIFTGVSLGSWALWLLVAVGLLASIQRPRLRTASWWLLAGFAATVIVLQLRPHYAGTPRYFIPAMLAAPLLAGGGVALLWSRLSTRIAALLMCGLIAGFSAVTLDAYYRGARPDWREVAVYVHERARPGDTVILANNWVVRNFGHYWLLLPQRPGVQIERFVPQTRPFQGPAWIVTGQCRAGEPLAPAGLMRRFPATDIAEVRYLRAGQSLSLAAELCPE